MERNSARTRDPGWGTTTLNGTELATEERVDDEPGLALGKAQSALLENAVRRAIFSHIEEAPGLHLRKIQRDLQIPLGTLEYHLHQLQRHELVVTREDRRFKAFFPRHGMDRRDRDVLYYLRQEMPRRIALIVADRPGITFKQISGRMPICGSTTSFHLKKLVEASIVQETKVGREKLYMATEPKRLRKLIVRYRKTFVDDVVDRFADAWLDVGVVAPAADGSDEGSA